METTRFVKANGAEISATSRYIVITGDNNRWQFAKTAGGRFSRSGLTEYPMWIEEGAIRVGLVRELNADTIRHPTNVEANIYCLLRGQVTIMKTWKLKDALERWSAWRMHEFDSFPPTIKSDDELVAAILSYEKVKPITGIRLTDYEVNRIADTLVYNSDSGRWKASNSNGWQAEKDDLIPIWSQTSLPGVIR